MTLNDLASELSLTLRAILYRLETDGADLPLTAKQIAVIRTPRQRGPKVKFTGEELRERRKAARKKAKVAPTT